MRISRRLPIKQLYQFRRTMSSVSEFVAAAVKADPTLAGSSDKDKTAISKLEAETEGYVRDLSVCDRFDSTTRPHANTARL